VYTQTFGSSPNRRFVIQWDTIVYLSGSQRVDFRAVLNETTGNIDVCYAQTTSGSVSYDLGASMTSGIQSGTGLALQYSCNTPSLTNGLWLTYIKQ
jgi:hypothetical protein